MFKTKALVAALGTLALTVGTAVQAAVPAAVETEMTAVQTDVIAAVAIAGGIILAVAGSGVIWAVAAKYIKRLRSAA